MNPDLVKGKIYKLIKSNNSATKYNGELFEYNSNNISGGLARIVSDKRKTFTVYNNGVCDDFVLADRKEQSTAMKEKRESLLLEIKKIDNEIEYLDKYDSEEEALADKLAKILKDPSKENIELVLKTMKKSDYL